MTTEQPPKNRRGPRPAGGSKSRFSGGKPGDRDSRPRGNRFSSASGDGPEGRREDREGGRPQRPSGKPGFGPKKSFGRDGDGKRQGGGKWGGGKPGSEGRGRGAPDGSHRTGPGADRRSDKPRKERPAEVESFDLEKGERIAKVMARAGLCSRRDAEAWIAEGRVEVNGQLLETPAVTVTAKDKVVVDGEPLPMRERTRLWLYHKPRGLVTTNKDPEGRTTVFERLPRDLPRVIAVGRLDINTEGLLLLTNDGGLARVLELPATGWLRRYRVRAFGSVTQEQLNSLAEGVAIDGVLYGAIEATLDKQQGDNCWLTVGLREGKNREVKRVLEHLGLSVNRLIRLSFGPFQLMELEEGEVREIRGRVLRDQLGESLAEEAGADFDAPLYHQPQAEEAKPQKAAGRGGERGQKPAEKGGWLTQREGESAKAGGRGGKRDDGRKGGDRPSGGQKRRKNAGERQVKVSPRSRFRLTSEPKSRPEREEFSRPARPPRRIWSEEGIVEDKRQEDRTGRDKKRPDRDGGFDREARGDRGGRPERAPRENRGPRADRPAGRGSERGGDRGGDRNGGRGGDRGGRPPHRGGRS
ncbi:pseudouridine synthase [Roseibium litorale]|uniref:Pseudouridine synthase n=1 Tax=Roseibium litorale TaxID=2803841 RepID=A0ABR9CQ37_9HYPH|nr:pseudouridine synthase [Roseibium litorale]MBD8892973.1 pseudouridine synthase [Roseibium litorale]